MSLQVERLDRNVPDPVRFQPGRTFVDLLLVLAFRIAVTVQRRQVLKKKPNFRRYRQTMGRKIRAFLLKIREKQQKSPQAFQRLSYVTNA